MMSRDSGRFPSAGKEKSSKPGSRKPKEYGVRKGWWELLLFHDAPDDASSLLSGSVGRPMPAPAGSAEWQAQLRLLRDVIRQARDVIRQARDVIRQAQDVECTASYAPRITSLAPRQMQCA